MNKLALATLITAASSVSAHAAISSDTLANNHFNKKEIKQQIRANKKKIRKLKKELRESNNKHLRKALRLAKKNNWALRKRLQDGRIVELVDVDAFNQPIYLTTYNAVAADSINTDEVWANGNAMLNLSGKGITVGVWDGGAVRTTHEEFNNALITDQNGNTALQATGIRAIQKDLPNGISNHATHVAGTIAAGGVWDAARGMANQSIIHAYDWNNDDAEMLAEAENGLLISNHSYGFVAGWSYDGANNSWVWNGNPLVSTEEDFRFGWYSSSSAAWDKIAETAPHYLIVKAAGNDQGDGPRQLSPGQAARDCEFDGFDCIGPLGVPKNILTIGAVEDIVGGYTQSNDVVAASFTSFGPTDDGRIKPDLVANGVGVLSTHGTRDDDKYYTTSGTSMSTPSVTGSLALLQEHYSDKNTYPMLAATLKGLAIHTASEAGSSDGPDYKFGWGLMDTQAAATVISSAERATDSGATNGAFIAELSSLQGKTLTIDLEPEEGANFIKATIVWSDPAGTPFNLISNAHDNRTPQLVNDLDMTIIETTATGEIKHQPYVMDPTRPNDAATRGDNNIDNVEQVVINGLNIDSTYQLQVAFDPKQSGQYTAESFSLVASHIKTPSCFAPSDLTINEKITTANTITVEWIKPLDSDGDVYISYRVAGEKDWLNIKADKNDEPFTLSGLKSNTEYEIRAAFECGTGSNLYSTIVNEKTPS